MRCQTGNEVELLYTMDMADDHELQMHRDNIALTHTDKDTVGGLTQLRFSVRVQNMHA